MKTHAKRYLSANPAKNNRKTGQQAKPIEVFEALSDALNMEQIETYIARRNSEVAGLLAFFKDTVEYFCDK